MAVLLLVDNDARIVELTAWFLERRGHEVRSAISYAAARARMAGEGAPDLMLADLELGVESGREELPRLSRQGELPPTLVVSGYLDADLRRELMELPNVLGTLAKPFDMPELEAEIARCLETAAASAAVEGSVPTPSDERRPPAPSSPSREWVPEGAKGSVEPSDPERAAIDDEEEDEDGWIEILPGALPDRPLSQDSPRS